MRLPYSIVDYSRFLYIFQKEDPQSLSTPFMIFMALRRSTWITGATQLQPPLQAHGRWAMGKPDSGQRSPQTSQQKSQEMGDG